MPQLIENFAAVAFCAFIDFGTGFKGYCNMERIRIEQVSQCEQLGMLVMKQQCGSLVHVPHC